MEHSANEVLVAIERETRERELFREQADALAAERMRAEGTNPPVIGVATITWEYMNSPHPIFLGLLEGIKSRLRASGCDLLLFTTIDPDPDAYLRRCRDSGVSGVILHGFTTDDARVSRLLEAGIPCVGVDDVGLAPRTWPRRLRQRRRSSRGRPASICGRQAPDRDYSPSSVAFGRRRAPARLSHRARGGWTSRSTGLPDRGGFLSPRRREGDGTAVGVGRASRRRLRGQ